MVTFRSLYRRLRNLQVHQVNNLYFALVRDTKHDFEIQIFFGKIFVAGNFDLIKPNKPLEKFLVVLL